MSIKRIRTGFLMILTMLLRRRIILLALIIIPVAFLTAVELTASQRIIPFRLASIAEKTFIEESQKEIALIFFAVANTGFLVSFLALNLVQIDGEVNRRLVICGYHPCELLVSNLLSLLLVIMSIALYIGLLVSVFVSIRHLLLFIFGLTLIGFVYGCYGLTIGSFIKGKLEGILFVFLLANIDVGWLQNPIYFAEANNNIIIRYLPAYFPSQSATIAAFTDYSMVIACLYSVLIGTGFLIMSTFIFYNKMRINK